MVPESDRLSANRSLFSLIVIAAIACVAWVAPPSRTAEAETRWSMAGEYPKTSMPGLGMVLFASRLAEKTGGAIQMEPSFDAAAGVKSTAMLDAVAGGKIDAGDAFAGALGAVDPIFALPSLPFLATSIEDAHRLADIARPHFTAALQRRGLKLLYLTPWPPSGIWSRHALAMPADLAGLSIRTYDAVSSEVLSGVGAKAASISFADTMPKLVDGSIDAVLSSGDGGAGRKLWQYLPHFTEIVYSLPLSIAVMSDARYGALSDVERRAVDAAGAETEMELWRALDGRL